MKYCIDKYPMGSFRKQKSAGKYIDGDYQANLKTIAKNIVNDMTFLGVCYSSTYEVGTGKSVFVQETGECYTELVNQIHGLKIPFTEKNIVFHPKDLIKTSFELPKYSMIILDEWEDAHYWSELGITLRQFFRKCRQLNLFIMVIIPNFFQLPIGYAISRSVFAVDVKFEDGFTRGFFEFYNFDRKKNLYIKGKKTYNYKVVKPNFIGRFTDGYAIPRDVYEAKKRNDLLRHEEIKKHTPTEKEIKTQMFKKVNTNLPGITQKQLAEAFGVSERTAVRWLKDDRDNKEGVVSEDRDETTQDNNNLNKK